MTNRSWIGGTTRRPRVRGTFSFTRVSASSSHRTLTRSLGRLILSLVATFAFVAATSVRAAADINDTEVTLSCSDGHSVTAAVDPTTLLDPTPAGQALVDDPPGPR